jgi:hypothetical protein
MSDTLEQEKAKLSAHVDDFAEEMKAKLHAQADKGYQGWDNGYNKKHLHVLLGEHVTKQLLGEDQAVDIANFAMMLHFMQGPSCPAKP